MDLLQKFDVTQAVKIWKLGVGESITSMSKARSQEPLKTREGLGRGNFHETLLKLTLLGNLSLCLAITAAGSQPSS